LTFGEEIRQGIALAFEQANGNAQLGRKVSLVTYDDATLTSTNTSAVDFLINQQQVKRQRRRKTQRDTERERERERSERTEGRRGREETTTDDRRYLIRSLFPL
jgi:hypothetical protein